MSGQGLTAEDVEKRRAQGLVNRVVRTSGRSVGDIVRSNVFTRINAILAVLFAIVMFTGSWINGAFGLLIIANSAIGIVQELRAKRTLDKLTIVGESQPRIIRDGTSKELPREDIVLDDLIELGTGDQLVVDGEVRSADGLRVDESMLTGESVAVHKHVGDTVLSGSFVVSGSGTYQALKIGSEAYAAKLVQEAGAFTLTDSELHRGIDKILRLITWLLVPVGALTIYTQLFRTHEHLSSALLAMVAALVPMVPEGLILMTSIAFAVGVVRLGRHKALVNELRAIETLARVDTVCVDKTGTLTENRMELDGLTLLDAQSDSPSPEIRSVLATMAHSDPRPNDTMQAIGEGFPDANLDIKERIAFDSTRKWSGMSFADPAFGAWVIGAPDVLLGASTVSKHVNDEVEQLNEQGLRVLLLARVPELTEELDSIEPVALVRLRQKVRDSAASTLDFFAHENVQVKVISGDNAQSVQAVASQVGIAGTAIDARTLPEDPSEDVENNNIFGRVTPEQKRQFVGLLREHGHSVAMTGDGVNDVLALKDANIGVSMGSGSPASRSVAQVVLLDNEFSTLPHVVAEGRRVIGNIERVANLFLTKTIYSVLLAFVVGVAGLMYPFQPIHVTLTGWFTIGIPALILSLAPNYERARPGFSRRVLRLALPSGLLIGAFTAGFWIWNYPGSEPSERATQVSTATLAVLIVMALWVLIIVSRPLNWWKLLLVGMSAVGYVLIFTVPWLQELLLLDSSAHALLIDALLVGGVGAGLIEVISLAVRRCEDQPT